MTGPEVFNLKEAAESPSASQGQQCGPCFPGTAGFQPDLPHWSGLNKCCVLGCTPELLI